MTINLPYSAELDLNRFRAHKINLYSSQASLLDDDDAKSPFNYLISFWQNLSLEDVLSFAIMEACWRYEE